MLEKNTVVVIKSDDPYIRDFNGKRATALEKEGLVSGNQMFALDGGGAVYLSTDQFVLA